MQNKLGFETLNDDIFQSQLKAKYKSKIFIGSFIEKRLCDRIKVYRDAIQISNKAEKEISKDLSELLNELQKYVQDKIFVGMTQNEEFTTIYTEIDESDLPFGTYWFQVNIVESSKYF